MLLSRRHFPEPRLPPPLGAGLRLLCAIRADRVVVVFRVGKVGAAKVGTGEVGAVEVRVSKVCAAKIGAAEIGPLQIGAGEVGIAEIGTAQVGVAQVRVAKVCATKVRAGECRAAQVRIAKIRAARLWNGTRFLVVRVLIEVCLRCQHVSPGPESYRNWYRTASIDV
ncbi:MAG: hypothetical protein WAN59_06815 [Candidatus Baltobacteraceae bacterium]